jgi:nuclear pore complex protein Nup133
VSQISSVFECLLEEEERTLKENPVDSVKWAEVVLSVNTIIKVHNTGSAGSLYPHP